ncbi:hypothetical protein M1105_00595 [Limibaculum sp. FT325]|uniref:hypothetical protein n=1 Tax=Thermohalobaculum sediminis TaxID=2939436 RepID=UPI0020C134FC|nr:hypothetical protein [Limibaculum sediminis]MCL5775495.1 hypothetical protein [Limibaculum sediminis]
MRVALALVTMLAAGPAGAQATPEVAAEGTLYCDHLEEIDAQREAENQGFDRIYASISTMTTASFCGYPELSDRVDERIRRAIWALDDRASGLTPAETEQLKQVKASYVLGRQMIDRRN